MLLLVLFLLFCLAAFSLVAAQAFLHLWPLNRREALTWAFLTFVLVGGSLFALGDAARYIAQPSAIARTLGK